MSVVPRHGFFYAFEYCRLIHIIPYHNIGGREFISFIGKKFFPIISNFFIDKI